MALAGIFILQIIFKNSISGIALGILFFLVNLYFLGALLSEFNKHAKQLLFVGLTIWIANFLVSVFMIYKYVTHEIKRNSQTELNHPSI